MQHHGVYNLEYRYRCKGAKSLLTKSSTLGLLHSFQFRRYRHPLAFRLRRLFYLFPPGVKHHRFYNCSYIYRLAILRRAVPALLQIASLVAACSLRRRHFLYSIVLKVERVFRWRRLGYAESASAFIHIENAFLLVGIFWAQFWNLHKICKLFYYYTKIVARTFIKAFFLKKFW